jgi:hypothetical membrane protein
MATRLETRHGTITFRRGDHPHLHAPVPRRAGTHSSESAPRTIPWPARPETAGSTYAMVHSYSRTRDTFRLLALTNLVFLSLAVAAFGERFSFLHLPFSDLGMPRTATGAPNYLSCVLFAVNMTICAVIMACFGRSCARRATTPHRVPKAALAFLAAAGFLVGIFPHDRFHVLHLAGCAAMVGSLWFLGNLFSLELHRLGGRRSVLVVQAVLQCSVLPYAAMYFAGADGKQALQKIAIMGLFVALTAVTRALRVRALQSALSRHAFA